MSESHLVRKSASLETSVTTRITLIEY